MTAEFSLILRYPYVLMRTGSAGALSGLGVWVFLYGLYMCVDMLNLKSSTLDIQMKYWTESTVGPISQSRLLQEKCFLHCKKDVR